jgi:hypothetical protein
MRTHHYEINGAHRGGDGHSRLLLDKLTKNGRQPSVEVSLVDPEPGRASALVPVFSDRGVTANAHQGTAQLKSTADVRVLAMDDVGAMSRIVDEPVNNDLLEAGILVTALTFGGLGGTQVGIAGAFTWESGDTQKDAGKLFNRVSALAGKRHTSSHSSSPFMNSMQMEGTRQALHDRLTGTSVDYLELGVAAPDLFVVDGLTRGRYPIVAQQSQPTLRNREMQRIATNEIIPWVDPSEDSFGVAFYDNLDPWILFVLARRRGGRWQASRAIELPVKPPQPINVDSAALRAPAPVTRPKALPRPAPVAEPRPQASPQPTPSPSTPAAPRESVWQTFVTD